MRPRLATRAARARGGSEERAGAANAGRGASHQRGGDRMQGGGGFSGRGQPANGCCLGSSGEPWAPKNSGCGTNEAAMLAAFAHGEAACSCSTRQTHPSSAAPRHPAATCPQYLQRNEDEVCVSLARAGGSAAARHDPSMRARARARMHPSSQGDARPESVHDAALHACCPPQPFACNRDGALASLAQPGHRARKAWADDAHTQQQAHAHNNPGRHRAVALQKAAPQSGRMVRGAGQAQRFGCGRPLLQTGARS
jgi:hypothetical protein